MAITAFEEIFLTLLGMQNLEHRSYRKGKGCPEKWGIGLGEGSVLEGGRVRRGALSTEGSELTPLMEDRGDKCFSESEREHE